MTLEDYTKYNPPLTPKEWQYLRDRRQEQMFSLNASDSEELEMRPGVLVTLKEWFLCQKRIAMLRAAGKFKKLIPESVPEATGDLGTAITNKPSYTDRVNPL
jgi:hypothetical protein